MKIEQKLAKNTNQVEKSPPRQIFYDFGLILGSLGDPKITKTKNKASQKKVKFKKPKNTKKFEKRLGEGWPYGMRRPWGGLWRGKKTCQNWKNMEKMDDRN